MENLKRELTKKLEGISLTELSKRSAVSKSAISKFLNGETEMQYHHMFSIVNAVFPDNIIEMMKEFSLSCKRVDNIKAAIEFAAFNRLDELVDTLIETNSGNKSISRFSESYVIFRKWNNREITAIELYKQANTLKTTSPEVSTFARLLEIYAFYNQRKFHFVLELTMLLEDEIMAISNEYIRRSYLIRYYDLMSYGHYACDNVEECRRYGANVIRLVGYDNVISGRIAFLIATTYFLDDYEKAMFYIQQSTAVFRKANRLEDLKHIECNAIPFVKNYWNITGDVEKYPVSEKAHYYVRIGDRETAIKYLDEAKKDGETAFYKYYRGIATDNIDLLYESLADFVAEGDYFYAKLPKNALLERGERKSAIKLAFSWKGE